MATDDEKIFTEEFFTQVRTKLIEEYEKFDEKYLLDEREYRKWLENDSYFRRYAKRKRGDLPATVMFLIEVLKWRQKLSVSDLSEELFPTEFFDLAGIHLYADDKQGNVVVYVRLRFFQKLAELVDLFKKFTIYQMFRADEEAAKREGDSGWVLFFDCTGVSVANVDIDMATFINNTLKNYFPSGQRYVLSYNLPWLMNALKTLIFGMVPSQIKNRIKFCNEKTIFDFIAAENLPPYIKGGTCERNYRNVPKSCIPIDDLIKLGKLSLNNDDQINRVKKYYEKLYSDVDPVKPQTAAPVIEENAIVN